MWPNTPRVPRGPLMWPAITAVLSTPGTALPRYQNACCHTGSLIGPSGASMTSFGRTPTPTTVASTRNDGIRSWIGTGTGPERMSRPGGKSGAGTGNAGTGRARTGVRAGAAMRVVVVVEETAPTPRFAPPQAPSAAVVATIAIDFDRGVRDRRRLDRRINGRSSARRRHATGAERRSRSSRRPPLRAESARATGISSTTARVRLRCGVGRRSRP